MARADRNRRCLRRRAPRSVVALHFLTTVAPGAGNRADGGHRDGGRSGTRERVRARARARRPSGPRRAGGVGIPRTAGLTGRVPRRLALLHAVRIPDHVTAARRAIEHGPSRSRRRSGRAGSVGSCPRAYACIALVLAAGGWWAAAQRRDLPGDVLAALAYVANWHFALGETTYQDLFTSAPSPLAHFWSLAVEEQLYFALPLVAALCLRWSRRVFAGVVVCLIRRLDRSDRAHRRSRPRLPGHAHSRRRNAHRCAACDRPAEVLDLAPSCSVRQVRLRWRFSGSSSS